MSAGRPGELRSIHLRNYMPTAVGQITIYTLSFSHFLSLSVLASIK